MQNMLHASRCDRVRELGKILDKVFFLDSMRIAYIISVIKLNCLFLWICRKPNIHLLHFILI